MFRCASDKIKNVKGWGRKGVEKKDLMHTLGILHVKYPLLPQYYMWRTMSFFT